MYEVTKKVGTPLLSLQSEQRPILGTSERPIHPRLQNRLLKLPSTHLRQQHRWGGVRQLVRFRGGDLPIPTNGFVLRCVYRLVFAAQIASAHTDIGLAL